MFAPLDQRLAPRPRLLPLGRLLPITAVLYLFAAGLPAAAFSQIGSQDGSERQKSGIVSVPLPPLPGAVEPARAETPVAPAPAAPAVTSPPAAPASQAAPPPATATPAPPTAPASPAAAPIASPPDAGKSDSPSEMPAATDGDAGEGDDPVAPTEPDAATPDESGDAAPDGDAAETAAETPPARVYYGDEGLTPAVRDLRQKLIEICRAGDIEALRPYLQGGEDATVLTFGDAEGDPITALKAASGDGQGVEMLAILLEVLQAGHVRSEPDTDDEIFVWPYFTGVPIDKLTNPQKVELFELVTAGDYQEMLGFGAYNFYRVGISPDGKLQFFVAGD